MDRRPVFISVTAISSRLEGLDHVLERLICQTFAADRIILNLSLEPYMLDKGVRFEHLPAKTRKWAISGQIEVYYCQNTGPYRKLLPVLERFRSSEYFVATADDDVLYPPEWLECLVESASEHNCIAAYRCRITESISGRLTPYDTWKLAISSGDLRLRGVNETRPSLRLFPTGRDGVIYHSSFLRDLEAFRELQKLAPGQDDIAIKFLTLLAGVPVVRAPRECTSSPLGFEFPGVAISGSSLWTTNSVGKNDEALADVVTWCQEHRNSCLQGKLEYL